MSTINPITGEELPLHDPHPETKGAEEGGGFCAESEDEGVEVWGGREGEEGEGERGGRGNEEGSGEVKIEGGRRRDTRSGGFVVEDDIATDADLLEELENFPELSSSESLCSKCQGPRINSDWKESFGVSICNSCKYGNPRYDLVTKSKAKQHYLLTEGELSGLGTISKPNPHKSTWAPMKLYLKEQVVKISRGKYANEEALEAEKERRSLIQLEKSIRREKNGGRLPSKRKARAGTLGKGGPTKMVKLKERHEHKFPTDKSFHNFDSKSGLWSVKCNSCDFKRVWEEL